MSNYRWVTVLQFFLVNQMLFSVLLTLVQSKIGPHLNLQTAWELIESTYSNFFIQKAHDVGLCTVQGNRFAQLREPFLMKNKWNLKVPIKITIKTHTQTQGRPWGGGGGRGDDRPRPPARQGPPPGTYRIVSQLVTMKKIPPGLAQIHMSSDIGGLSIDWLRIGWRVRVRRHQPRKTNLYGGIAAVHYNIDLTRNIGGMRNRTTFGDWIYYGCVSVTQVADLFQWCLIAAT